MYDSVTPSLIPKDAQMVAGYITGKYAWTASDWDMFPNATKVHINVDPTIYHGHVLDVEPGDATAQQAVQWVKKMREMGTDPTLYTGWYYPDVTGYNSHWDAVKAAFDQAGVAQPHYWVANWTTSNTIPAGAVAIQWKNVPNTYDVSNVQDYWAGVDPISKAPTTPVTVSPIPPKTTDDITSLQSQMNQDIQNLTYYANKIKASVDAINQKLKG